MAAVDDQQASPQQSSELVSQVVNGEYLQGEQQALAALARQATVVDAKKILEGEPPPELDETSGVPKQLKSFIVHDDPKIYLVPNFVTDREIEHLLELAEEGWTPSTVGAGVYKTNNESQDLKNQQSVNRTSYSCMLRSAQTPTVMSVELRLAALAGMEVEYLERLNMVRYAPGQFFNKHHDGRFRPITVFLYLNDLPEGDHGETFFPELGLKFKPVKGCAVMWRNTLAVHEEDVRTVHQGLPPKTTMKYGVNCFFNEKPMKAFEGVNDIYGKPTSEADYHTIDPQQLVDDRKEASADDDAGKIVAFAVSDQPKVKVVPNLLSPEEVNALLALVEPGMQRTSSQEDVFETVADRIAAVAGLPAEYMEPMKVCKCDPNMLPDGLASCPGRYVEVYGTTTVYVHLNDTDGGDLSFPGLKLQIRPRRGTATIWSAGARTPTGQNPGSAHQSRAPRSGARYGVICAFRDAPVN